MQQNTEYISPVIINQAQCSDQNSPRNDFDDADWTLSQVSHQTPKLPVLPYLAEKL